MIQNLEREASEYSSLTEVVFKNLRRAILNGELLPGERLMEIPLANQFRVSRTPVREAIRKLEVEGLALMLPGRGAEVAKIAEKDLRDVLEVRNCLERIAIGLACERITAEWFAEFEAALEMFYHAVCSKDIRKIAESDVCFHELIFEVTGNSRLIQTMNNLKGQMYRYRLEYLKGLSGYMQLYREHYEIYDAIRKCDKELAQKLMDVHIYRQEQALIKKM